MLLSRFDKKASGIVNELMLGLRTFRSQHVVVYKFPDSSILV